MPQLDREFTEEDLSRRSPTGGLDLSAYMDIIDNIREQGGVGGSLSLSEDENQRTEKRRMSVAAKERGLTLVWRKAPDRQLRFDLAEEGKPAPGARQRKNGAKPAPAAEPTAPATASGRKGRGKKA